MKIRMTADSTCDLTPELIRKYEIRYVYVGKLEREKFPALNDGLLREVGTVVYEDGETYIVEMP